MAVIACLFKPKVELVEEVDASEDVDEADEDELLLPVDELWLLRLVKL